MNEDELKTTGTEAETADQFIEKFAHENEIGRAHV